MLKQAFKLDEMLKGKKTKIAFVVHDSIVLDMAKGEEHSVNELFHAFAENELGEFLTNARAGTNYGELKKLWIQL